MNKKCADYVMFEKTESGFRTHIFEMKKTVKEDNWNNKTVRSKKKRFLQFLFLFHIMKKIRKREEVLV